MDLEALLVDDENEDELSLDGIDLEELLQGNESDSSDEHNPEPSRALTACSANLPERLFDLPISVVNEELEQLLRQIDEGSSTDEDEVGNQCVRVESIVADFAQPKADIHQVEKEDPTPSTVQANQSEPSSSAMKSANQVPAPASHKSSSGPGVLAARKSRLELVHAREQRSLKTGVSEALSPLQGKRRSRTRGEKEIPSQSLIGADSGPSGGVVLNSMEAISRQLRKNAAVNFQHSPGLPTALAAHTKFIAIGTDRGLVIVFDHFQEVRQILGSTSDAESDGPITAVDVSPKTDILVSGFASGKIVLWDILKGTALKAVVEAHTAAVAAVRFIHHKDAAVVSVDTRGCVNKINFTKTMWMSSYNISTECLLDGAAGQVPAMSVTPPWRGSTEDGVVRPQHQQQASQSIEVDSEASGPLHGNVLIAISSEKSSFVIAVEPVVKVVFKWPRPSSVERSTADPFIPCLSWGWSLIQSGSGEVHAVLARAWGSSVELLQAIPNQQPGGDVATFNSCPGVQSTAPIVAVEWLGPQTLVYMDINYALHVVDTASLNEIEVLDLSALQLVFATYMRGGENTEEEGSCALIGDEMEEVISRKKDPESFQNSLRCCDARLYCLGHSTLHTVRMQSWTQRIESLVEDGEWLEALALSLDFYEMNVKPMESRMEREHSSHQEHLPLQVSQEIADLLLRYLKLAIENAPVQKSVPHRSSRSTSTRSARVDLVQSHFQMIAGVCLEYCTVTGRLDLLFGTIFNRFLACNHARVLLDLLEPYILQDSIPYLSPEVLAAFVEHHQHKSGDDLSVVERCLLHMDVKMLDFNSIVTLLRRHRLYSALVHVYTSGLDDFVSPLEFMLEGALEALVGETQALPKQPTNTTPAKNAFEIVGFKALLFLHLSFKGKSFFLNNICGDELRPERVLTLQKELLDFVLLPDLTPSSRRRLKHDEETDYPCGHYPYLRVLLQLDCELTLEAFALVLDRAEEDTPFPVSDPLVLFSAVGRVLAPRLHNSSSGDEDSSTSAAAVSWWQPLGSECLADFLEFTAKYMGMGVVRPPQAVVDAALQHLAGGRAGMTSKEAHDLVARTVALLGPTSIDTRTLMPLLESSGFSRAALVVHKAERGPQHFAAAIQCFLMDDDLEFRIQVFDFMTTEVEQQGLKAQAAMKGMRVEDEGGEGGRRGSGGQVESNAQDVLHAMKSCIMVQLAVLIDLDSVSAVKLVAQVFGEDHQRVLAALADTPRQQFGLLSGMVAASHNSTQHGDASDEHTATVWGGLSPFPLDARDLELYVDLLAQYDPAAVYKYLSTHSDYPINECVKICRERHITDAEAYLLERTGDISGALDLTLQSIEKALEALKLKLRSFTKQDLAVMGILAQGGPVTSESSSLAAQANGRTVLVDLAEGQNVERNLGVAMEVCERSTSEDKDEQALWNYTLDRLLMTKTLLKLGSELPYQRVVLEAVLTEVMQVAWNKMSAYVPLARIVRKMTDEHSEMHLGELRDIILSVLDTSSHESSIYQSSLALVGNDVYGLTEQRRKLKGAGISIRGIRMGSELYQLGSNNATQVQPLERGSTVITSSRGGVADMALEDAMGSIFAHGEDATKIRVARTACLERRARRAMANVSLQDRSSGDRLPTLLTTAPGGIPPPEKPPANRVPGSLPKDAMHLSEF